MSENIGEQYDNILQIGSGCSKQGFCHFFIKFKRQSWNNHKYDVNLKYDDNTTALSDKPERREQFLQSHVHEIKEAQEQISQLHFA